MYQVKQDGPDASAESPKLVPVLEEMPKWACLQQVADEIQTQRALLASHAGCGSGDKQAGSDSDDGSSPCAMRAPAGAANGVSIGRAAAGKAPSSAVNGVGRVAGDHPASESDQQGTDEPPARPAAAQANGKRPRHALDDHALISPGSAVAHHAGESVEKDVIDLLESQSPSKKRPPSPLKRGAQQQATHAAAPAVGPAADGQASGLAHAWVQHLTAETARACAAAPVLVLAQERHMLSELRSILAVRPGISAATDCAALGNHGCVLLHCSLAGCCLAPIDWQEAIESSMTHMSACQASPQQCRWMAVGDTCRSSMTCSSLSASRAARAPAVAWPPMLRLLQAPQKDQARAERVAEVGGGGGGGAAARGAAPAGLVEKVTAGQNR